MTVEEQLLKPLIPPRDTLALVLQSTNWTTYLNALQICKIVQKVLPVIGKSKRSTVTTTRLSKNVTISLI